MGAGHKETKRRGLKAAFIGKGQRHTGHCITPINQHQPPPLVFLLPFAHAGIL